jgi:hypothetical protein
MVFSSRQQYLCRSGPQDRIRPDRFTYVKGTGWFVHMRGDQEMCDGIEVSSGIIGPFNTRLDARVYLIKIVRQTYPEYKIESRTRLPKKQLFV